MKVTCYQENTIHYYSFTCEIHNSFAISLNACYSDLLIAPFLRPIKPVVQMRVAKCTIPLAESLLSRSLFIHFIRFIIWTFTCNSHEFHRNKNSSETHRIFIEEDIVKLDAKNDKNCRLNKLEEEEVYWSASYQTKSLHSDLCSLLLLLLLLVLLLNIVDIDTVLRMKKNRQQQNGGTCEKKKTTNLCMHKLWIFLKPVN